MSSTTYLLGKKLCPNHSLHKYSGSYNYQWTQHSSACINRYVWKHFDVLNRINRQSLWCLSQSSVPFSCFLLLMPPVCFRVMNMLNMMKYISHDCVVISRFLYMWTRLPPPRHRLYWIIIPFQFANPIKSSNWNKISEMFLVEKNTQIQNIHSEW